MGQSWSEKGQKWEAVFSPAVVSSWADEITETNREEGMCQRTALWQTHRTASAPSIPSVIPNVIFLSERAASFDKPGRDFLMCRASLGGQNFFKKQCCKWVATVFARGEGQRHTTEHSKCCSIWQVISIWCYSLAYMEDVSGGKYSYFKKLLLIDTFLDSGHVWVGMVAISTTVTKDIVGENFCFKALLEAENLSHLPIPPKSTKYKNLCIYTTFKWQFLASS